MGSTRSISAGWTRALLDLDGTADKSALGANAVLGASLAVARAAADRTGCPCGATWAGRIAHVLPTPMMNVINGGAHADNELELQEFMVMPVGAASFSEASALGRRVLPRAEGDPARQGTFDGRRRRGRIRAADRDRRRGARAAAGGHRDGGPRSPGDEVALAHGSRHDPSSSRTAAIISRAPLRSSDDIVEYWDGLLDRFPIVSVEDGLAEDDWRGLAEAHHATSDRASSLVGDDLFVTDPERRPGCREGCANTHPGQVQSDRVGLGDARRDRLANAAARPPAS